MSRKLTQEEFIEKVSKAHSNKYDYSKTKYIDSNTNITIICPEHGEFKQSANNHLYRKQGCSKCSGKYSYTTEEFIFKANLTHNNKYYYDHVVYKNNSSKVLITCPVHGDFEQRPNDHLSNRGCPHCSKNGFKAFEPAILYYLKVTVNSGQNLYKIGITNKTVNERFNLTELNKIEIIKQTEYLIGQDAYDEEQRILKEFKEFKYTGPAVLVNGNTELFTKDVLK